MVPTGDTNTFLCLAAWCLQSMDRTPPLVHLLLTFLLLSPFQGLILSSSVSSGKALEGCCAFLYDMISHVWPVEKEKRLSGPVLHSQFPEMRGNTCHAGLRGQARRRQDAEQAGLTGGPWLGLLLGLPRAREAEQFRSC